MTDQAGQHPEGKVDPLAVPNFLKRAQSEGTRAVGGDEPAPGKADEVTGGQAAGSGEDFQEDEKPPYKGAQETAREQEQALERQASGHTAEELAHVSPKGVQILGKNGKPLIEGDVATVTFGEGKKAYDKTGTLLKLEPEGARVRLKGSKDPLGEIVPIARISTEPVNGGRPTKTGPQKKAAAEHANDMTEFREALARGDKPRPSDGFAHAHAAADDETAPLPKRVLQGHNTRVSEATIYRHLGVIRSHMEKLASAQGKLREAWKKAKDDGVDAKALKKIMEELKMSPEEIIANENMINAYRGAVHLPHHAPLDDMGDAARDTDDKRITYAGELGYQAGFRGANMSTNPYPDPTDPCHVAWNDKWAEAQKKLGAQIKQLDS